MPGPGSVVPLALGLDTAGVQVPWYFRCPISLELMRDPVTVSTGQTYDRASIESWVATGNTTCPVTRAPLADFTFIPNHTLRRLIQEWCVAHRSMGVERIPTPKQPADPDLVRSLVAQGPGLPALRRLRALARESDKNRLVMATHETRAALVDVAFGSGSGSGASEELEAEAMAVLALVGLGEAEAAEVVGREDRVARLGKVLAAGGPLEARVNAGAVVEAATSASGAEARATLGAAEGVMEGLVALVEEKANARAVRVGIRGLFALCLAKENRARAVSAGAASAAAGPKVVRLSPSSSKLQLEDVSDTLYVRPSLLADATKKPGPAAPALTVSPAIAEMIRGKMDRPPRQSPCWSDCDCKVCHAWSAAPRSASSHLYVHVQAPPPPETPAVEDVVFIHGFISSSVFWTETVFPAFSAAARGRYRMLAVDLLGFGRSPKPAESLYTLREHVESIERSVLQRYRLGSFHVVAHSLGSVLALALAVKYPDAVKSLTLLAPPYFPVPETEAGAATQYVMRRVAPRRVWPPIAFGASMACWYEHVSRTICLTICRHHRVWDRLFRIITRNRVRTFLIEAFMCHTHNAAWHTLHNIICGSAARMDAYLDVVATQLSCKVAVFHGRDDELLPVECTLAVGARVPRARVTVYDRKDHITIIVGQEELFAAELEGIWRSAAAE